MTCFSNEPRDQIFVKDYEFLPFAKNVSKNFDKNISKCSRFMLALLQMHLKLFQK